MLAVWALLPAASLAAVPPVYSNVPSSLPGNVPSVGYEATSTSEFGDLVQLAGSQRSSGNLPVTVVMSIWACETGGDATCVTTPGATWSQPLTLNIYAVDRSAAVPAPGTLLTSATHTFDLPYRPSFDPSGPCAGKSTGWYQASSATCFNGFAYPARFALPAGVTLPDEIIWTVAFNTAHHGYAPTGVNGPWNSLNVGVKTFGGEPAYGVDVEPDSAFVNSSWSGMYKDGGLAGLGTLRDDVGGWHNLAPLACIGATCSIEGPGATPTPTATPTATATATATATPTATGTGTETPTPIESVAGVTSAPTSGTTPPPTSTTPGGNGNVGTPLILMISLGYAALGSIIFAVRRRATHRA